MCMLPVVDSTLYMYNVVYSLVLQTGGVDKQSLLGVHSMYVFIVPVLHHDTRRQLHSPKN